MRLPIRSLKARLTLLALAAAVVVLGGAATWFYFEAREGSQRNFDAQLAQAARLLLQIAEAEREELLVAKHDTLALTRVIHEHHYFVQIRDAGGKLLFQSADVDLPHRASRSEGYSFLTVQGVTLRTYARWNDGQSIYILIGDHVEESDEPAAELMLRLSIAVGVAIPILSLLLAAAVKLGLMPLANLARAISRRDVGDSSPLEAEGAPSEVTPLIRSLNDLLARIEASVERERRFTADAAHELRTPLAALRSQIQLALREPDRDASRQWSREALEGVDRATTLVNHLPLLARAERPVRDMPGQIDLQATIHEVLPTLEGAAAQKHVEIDDLTEPTLIAGDPTLVSALVRNLIDNAIKFSPAGGTVRVTCRPAPQPEFEVSDEGPGIPAAHLPRIGDRFHRVPGTDAPGSGLGLSIARAIAQQHGATLQLVNLSEGGLLASVRFPRPPRPSATADRAADVEPTRAPLASQRSLSVR